MSLVLSVAGSGSVVHNLVMPYLAESTSLTGALSLSCVLTFMTILLTWMIRHVQLQSEHPTVIQPEIMSLQMFSLPVYLIMTNCLFTFCSVLLFVNVSNDYVME